MRRVLLAVLLAALPTALSAQRKIDARFPAAPDGFVRIQNIAGSVQVSGWDRDSISVAGSVHDTPNEQFTIQRTDGGVQLGVWDITVERVPPSTLEIRVPARSHVWVQTGSSSITVAGVTGGVDANSVGGTIQISGTPRELFAESMMGEVVLDVRTSTARAKTVSGSIRIGGSISDVGATSVSGSVTIEGAGIERGRFESVNGDLRYIGDIGRAASLDFINHAGAVDFLLPAATNASFVISSYEGILKNEFPVSVRRGGGKIKGMEQSFVLGSGIARVTVRTFRGTVIVRRK